MSASRPCSSVRSRWASASASSSAVAAASPWLATVPSLLLATLFTLVMTEAVAFVPAYGIDAIRDSVILLYSLFAFIVIALILEKPGRLNWTLLAYGRFAWLYGMIGGVVYLLSVYLANNVYDSGLYFPGTNIEMPFVRAGEAASHVSGAAVFMLLGLRRVPLPWVLLLFANIVMVVPNRGAMLSCVIPLALAAVLGGQMRRVTPVLLFGGLLLAVTYAIGFEIPDPDKPEGTDYRNGTDPREFREYLGHQRRS